MLTRGTLCAGGAGCVALVLFGVVVLLAAGCNNQPKPKPAGGAAQRAPAEAVTPVQGTESPADADTAAPQADRMEASFGTADALARKAETYSREVASLLAQRATSDPKAAPASEPSQVQWADPSDFRLGDAIPASGNRSATQQQPPQQQQPPEHQSTARPVIETSPSQANQMASIAPTPEQNVIASANQPARADDPATHPATHPAAPGAPAPANASAAMSLASSAGLSEKLATRVREYPRDVSAHLEYQLLQLLLDEQVPQLAALAPLPSEDRELVSAVLDGLSLFRSTLRSDNNMLLSKKIRPLIDMADRLRSQADLTIPTVALCKSVEGFGKYEPLDARFAAGAEHKAIVYCEVANFASNRNDKQQWETRLRQELVLYTEFGVPVWNDRTETILDAARNRRHDFFVNKRIVIPGNLGVGRYLLKVSIVDEQANRVAEQTVPIVIAAK